MQSCTVGFRIEDELGMMRMTQCCCMSALHGAEVRELRNSAMDLSVLLQSAAALDTIKYGLCPEQQTVLQFDYCSSFSTHMIYT